MSQKAVANFVTKVAAVKNAPAKFTPSLQEGSRILPSRTKDVEFQFRLDAGHYDNTTKKLNVVMQANSQATSPGIKEWIRKNSTHAKLAVATFDTAADDKQAELERMLEDLETQAQEKLKA